MATFTKNGSRKFKLDNQKNALKQINNFGSILANMNILNQEIDNYQGIITPEKLEEIITLINLEKKLNLTEEQLQIVKKSYE